MTLRPADLPDFTDPPVVEVAFAVRFEPLRKLTAPEIGRFWTTAEALLPNAEEATPLPPALERFDDGIPGNRVFFSFGTESLGTRVILSDANSEHLVQVQHDMFGTNWRKREERDYPHFEALSAVFLERFDAFVQFLADRRLGSLEPTQCELTYVNYISALEGQEPVFAKLPTMVSVLQPASADSQVLRHAEDFNLSFRYRFNSDNGGTLGRLYLQVAPMITPDDGKPVYLMTLTAKGPPESKNKEGIIRFFSTARQWIVRGFTEATVPAMHEKWGRKS